LYDAGRGSTTIMKYVIVCMLLSVLGLAQWVPVAVPTKASVRGLSVVSEKIVWVSGTQGTVLRTTDGGRSWAVTQVPGAEKLDFRGIRAFDAQTALVMSSGQAEQGQARVYRTHDGGAHWDLVLEEKTAGVFFDAIAFWDRRHGILLSDPVDGRFAFWRTEDGGETWSRLSPTALPAALEREGAFAASNSALVVEGKDNVWFGTGGASVARVFRSRDRGTSWSVSETPMHPANASSGIFSLAFRDAANGIAVGGDYANPAASPSPNILITKDGGATWSDGGTSDPPGLYFSSVAFVPGSDAVWAVGSRGSNHKENGVWHKSGSESFNAVAFLNDDTGWAVGPEGMVARWSGK
jgi:photosystem II stability/assembly factor-like uncharacterized protein